MVEAKVVAGATRAVHIRKIAAGDAVPLSAFNDPGVRERIVRRIMTHITAWKTRDEGVHIHKTTLIFVIEIAAEKRIAGVVGLHQIDWRGGVAVISVFVDPALRRRNIARDALRLTMAHAFQKEGLRQLSAHIDPQNAASIALHCSLGFTRSRQKVRFLQGEHEYIFCDPVAESVSGYHGDA